MTATAAAESIQIGRRSRTAWYPVPVENGGVSGGRLDRARVPWRWRTALTDCVALLALAWSIPFAVLLVGAPVALTIALVLWLGRLALSAF